MADVSYQSSTLAQLYAGTNSGAYASGSKLTTFRTGGDTALDTEIAGLDQRIAAFESVLIGNIAAGKNSGEFPYDRESLRREFLDEVLALLLRRSIGTGAVGYAAADTVIYSNSEIMVDIGGGVVVPAPGSVGGQQPVLKKNGTTGTGNFDNLSTAGSTATNDPRLNLLSDEGKAIFRSYLTLIDAVFAEGDTLGNDPAPATQLVSAITAITVDGVTYDAIAQVTGVDANGNLAANTYLLEAGTARSVVTKDARGQAQLSGPASATTRRLLLSPQTAAWDAAAGEHLLLLDGLTLRISPTAEGVAVRTSATATATPAEPISPLLLNLPGSAAEFPDAQLVSRYRYTAGNGTSYLIGLGSDGRIHVTSLASARRESVGATASLSSLEYLLYYNEARIKILRAQLGYREAVVREIQDDLKRANQVLAELEVQSGYITAQNDKGQPTGQISSETLTMNLFVATHSTAGANLFRTAGNDAWHGATEWAANRTSLKNYIDRRSAEAQEATLDYQNTLNRFNNAFEVMAKLQEKLDTLLKAQLRNLG